VPGRRQSGATAIEFALVLPMLIALTYSTFVYSYVFVVYESINFAAQQGAEAAVAVDTSLGSSYEATVTSRVQLTVASVLHWLPAAQKSRSIGTNGSLVQPVFCDPDGGGSDASCPATSLGGTPIVVSITFPLLDPSIFPILNLPGLGSIPPLPASIRGVGVTLVSG
jgi:Flp pilus assembly protein TadG